MNIRLHVCLQKVIWEKTTQRLLDHLSKAINQNKKTLLFLSGGSAAAIYKDLAGVLLKKDFATKKLIIAQVDERFQPENRNDINAEAIAKADFQLSYYIVRQDGLLSEATRGYNSDIVRLMEWADYKVAILGIGEDCHTAGLIPGYKDSWDKDSFVVGYFLANEQEFKQRITVTPKLLAQLNYALIVAVGENKKEAIKNALKKENLKNLNKYPAAIIQKIPQVDLFTTTFEL